VEEFHEVGRRNNKRLRNELKRATDVAKKECLEIIRDESMEFQRCGLYDFNVHEDEGSKLKKILWNSK
jgi:hypothetical protein